MRNASLLLAAILVGIVAEARGKSPPGGKWSDWEGGEGVDDSEEVAMQPVEDLFEAQINNLVDEIAARPKPRHQHHHARGSPPSRRTGKGKNNNPNRRDQRNDKLVIASKVDGRRHMRRPGSPPEAHRKIKIASEENGKRFLRKYCSNARCKLPREPRLKQNHQRRHRPIEQQHEEAAIQRGPRHKRYRKSGPKSIHKHDRQHLPKRGERNVEGVLNAESNPKRTRHHKRHGHHHHHHHHPRGMEGPIEAVERSVRLTRDKYVDRRMPRDDRPIIPWEENDDPNRQRHVQAYDKELVIIKPLKSYPPVGKDNDGAHPPFEVNQINLHVDVDVKQQQAQQEKQAIVQVDQHIDHPHIKNPSVHIRHGESPHAEHRAPFRQPDGSPSSPSQRHRNAGRRRRPLAIAATTSNRHQRRITGRRPQHSLDSRPPPPSEEDFSREQKNRCDLAEMRRYVRMRLDKWRRTFDSESFWAKTGMVMALAAIITMQVYVISKFIKMLFGRAVYGGDEDEGNDDDEDGDEDSKGMSNYKNKSRRTGRRRHSCDARAPMLDKN